MSDRFGQAYGLTMLSPITGSPNGTGVAHDVLIRNELRALNALPQGPFASVTSTHLARWVVIDDAPYESLPAKIDHLASKYLLFTSNFDGGSDDDSTARSRYLESMRTQMPDVLERVYAHCLGFPGTTNQTAFHAYMDRCRVPTTFLFGAYGNASRDQVLASLELQRSMGEFIVAQQLSRPSPQHLKERFLHFVEEAGLVPGQSVPFGPEVIPPGEPAATAVVRDVVLGLMNTTAQPVPRTQHGHAAGVVRAELEVADDLPAELQHGIFRECRRYPALVRFSNAAETDESKADTHGLAIKLFDVSGQKVLDEERNATTQDFLFVDHATFFIRNAPDYAVFAPKLLGAVRLVQKPWAAQLPAGAQKLLQFGYLLTTYLLWHRHEAGILGAMRAPPPKSPLDARYWSTTPYRLGPHAVHWSVRPQSINAPLPPVALNDPSLGDPANQLRAALVSQLSQRDAAFDLYVQLQTDPVAMPVEDPTIPWDEQRFPPRRVATLHIPRQDFDTAAKKALTLGLSFDPWHSLPEHQPLGGINRVRKVVYVTAAGRRRELNGVARTEPTVEWLRTQWDR